MSRDTASFRKFNAIMKIQRSVARRVEISDLINGRYFKEQNFEPNYVLTNSGLRVARALIVGTVTDIYQAEDYGNFTVDDGTASIRIKFFQDLGGMSNIEKGDLVEVIGKPKQYDNEIYIVPESISKVKIERELLRKIELRNFRENWKKISGMAIQRLKSGEGIENLKDLDIDERDLVALENFINLNNAEFSTEEKTKQENVRKVIEAIKKLDKEDGADYSEISREIGITEEELDRIITELLEDGTCFEPRPGKIKVV